MPEPHMVDDGPRDAPQVRAGRPEVSGQMSSHERPETKAQTVQNEDPGEEEMPPTPHGQPLRPRQCRPGREAALLELASAFARGAQHPRRIELASQDLRDAPRLTLGGFHCLQSEQRALGVRALTPVERRMRVEDLEPAHDQDDEAERGEPVAEPGRQRVAVDPALGEDHDETIRYTMRATGCVEDRDLARPAAGYQKGKMATRWPHQLSRAKTIGPTRGRPALPHPP